ncbi:hypothetical protein [Streptosporangium sp. NPDC002524]|uniref:hypothetical protein n=1 Tax=Streptosporangium sp. NPDC002524 TaxID=3154537 RepID=UPI00331B1328
MAQYTSLRAEIVSLTALQFQITAVTTVSFGAVLSAGFQVRNAAIILVYPLLSLVLGIIWLFKAHLITRIAAFIRTEIEDRVGRENMGWEHYVQAHPLPGRRLAYWGLRAIFPVTSLIAIGVSVAVASQGLAMIVSYVLAAIFTIVTFMVFFFWQEPSPELGRKARPTNLRRQDGQAG